MKSNASEILKSYHKWVRENPTRASEVETLAKWLSYFAAGKLNDSALLSELVYSLSNLFSLYNDTIIRKANGEFDGTSLRNRLKMWLTVLHYSEVLIELTSRSKWGNRGKWSAAVCVQLLRCASNLALVWLRSECPVSQPPVPVLHRNRHSEEEDERKADGFALKRSGRVIRRVEAAPPACLRDWKPLSTVAPETTPHHGSSERNKRIAETVYAIKPLVHLGSVAFFGSDSWKQWLVNLAMDLYSLHVYNGESNTLNYQQRLEINRRKFSLLLYLLRSPMYQKHSGEAIKRTLLGISATVPLLGIICNPIAQHLPNWQDTYFYMWSN